MKNVVQLLPRSAPARCGIADYSIKLAQELRARHGIQTTFLSLEAGKTAAFEIKSFRVIYAAKNALAIRQQLEALRDFDAIILHVSLYGYQRRGLPLYLAKAIRLLSSERIRVVSMFHELYATGSWNSSPYWTQPIQMWILGRIAKRSSAIVTNREQFAGWLRTRISPHSAPVVTLPVISNFGELENPPPLAGRHPAMIFFATANQLQKPLAGTLTDLKKLCNHLNLKELHVIGAETKRIIEFETPKVTFHGFLEQDAVSQLLSSCRVGYSAYPSDYLAKSSIMAAFTAHGVAVVCAQPKTQFCDGLTPGKELLSADKVLNQNVDNEFLQRVADAGHQWYARHNLTATGLAFAKSLNLTVEG